MARTLSSHIGKHIIGRRQFYMYGQFPNYGRALNYCIKEDIPIKKIKPISTINGDLDFYSIEGIKNTFKLGEWIKR